MDKKLIFLDIDGTLVPAGSNTPPESAVAAVKQAQACGHLVFLCTGRNPAMLAPLMRFGFQGAVACAGGYVFAGDQVLFDCPMLPEQLELGLRLLKEQGVFRTIEAKDATWGDDGLEGFLGSVQEENSELVRWRRALADELNILPMGRYDGRPVYKIVFMCRDEEQLGPAKKALERDYSFIYHSVPEHHCLNGELINRRFDKGRGVRIVAERFGIPLENTIGFGDSMNDLEMIETVGVSVCMGNGSAALKEKSSLICPGVEDNGLAWAFSELGLI